MIAHSLVQEGPGFPYLAPVIYSYISSGDLQVALLKVSIMDVCDPILAGVTKKVRAYMRIICTEEHVHVNVKLHFSVLIFFCSQTARLLKVTIIVLL